MRLSAVVVWLDRYGGVGMTKLREVEVSEFFLSKW